MTFVGAYRANYALFRMLAQVNSNQYSGNNRASLHTPSVVFSMHCCFMQISPCRLREESPFSESVPHLSPPPKRLPSNSPPNGSDNELSSEQKLRMERNRLEAEARVITKKLGAEKLGLTWVKALLAEFKKPYMQEVSFDLLHEGELGAGVCCSDR